MSITLTAPHWPISDFTTFISAPEASNIVDELTKKHACYLDDTFDFSTDKKSSSGSGRGVACYCCDRQAISLSMRLSNLTEPDYGRYEIAGAKEQSTWAARDAAAETLCKLLDQLVLQHRDTPRGVIAFFGETGSRKSTLARGLVDLYLLRQVKRARDLKEANKGGRRPHLLTFEDPIEVFYGPSTLGDESLDCVGRLRQTAEKLGVDYTPRRVGQSADCASLDAGLSNARRQKPAVVFVGEVRAPDDWRSVLDFAGTGHLIVTTSHGGSLIESMSNILSAADAHTPAARSFVAGRVLALVHVRQYDDADSSVIVPAIWRRTPAGANTLVTDGLGSVLPHNPAEVVPPGSDLLPDESSLGRHWFARSLYAESGDKLLRRTLLDDLQAL